MIYRFRGFNRKMGGEWRRSRGGKFRVKNERERERRENEGERRKKWPAGLIQGPVGLQEADRHLSATQRPTGPPIGHPEAERHLSAAQRPTGPLSATQRLTGY